MSKAKYSKVNCRKLFIFPVWQCDKLDIKLSDMENNGYRLIGTSFLGFMHFRKSAPKKVRYFTTYTCLRERSMNGIEDVLRSVYKANPVPTAVGTRNVHRLTDTEADLGELEELRKKTMPRVIGERLFFSLVPLIGILLFCIQLRLTLLNWIVSTLIILALAYYTIGMLSVLIRHADRGR